uniref:RNA helicase n=1 Tax=Salarias fasciatus TaxID=181472 RepID=A0A672IJP7_SALFA
MKKAFTAEQISCWFTSGTTFANVSLSEEAPETKSDAVSSKRSRYEDASSLVSMLSHQACNLKLNVCVFCVCARFQLISLIEQNSVVIIRGSTGSGKTTQLPQYILDHCNEKKQACNIVVTQPRKIGASSIARWVAAQRKCTLGSLVGYQIGLERVATVHTRLIYMTTGVLLQKVVSSKCLAEYTHIFLDEVHERTEEMDFLLLVLRKLLHSNSHHVKIILMSATINCKEFADYFAMPVHGRMKPAYVFELEGAPFAIEQFYLDDLLKMFPNMVDKTHPDEPFISEEMYNLAINLIQSFDEMEGKDTSAAAKDGATASSERGSVLVFLPGLNEIYYMQEALAKLVHKRLQVYPLHSTVTLEEQNVVFLSPSPLGCFYIISKMQDLQVFLSNLLCVILCCLKKKIVFCFCPLLVIDFCLARRLMCDPETNYQSLCLTWASKTSCNQRRGTRPAGRVSKGYCYRLITKHFWQKEVTEYMIPEMLLAPLGSIVLKVKLLDMGDPPSLLSAALSPPKYGDIVKSVLQLKEMGALSVRSDGGGGNSDGQLTFLGRVLAQLPVDLYLGKLIVLGHVFGCLDECLIIAAARSLKCFFAIPLIQQLAGHRSKLSYAQGIPSDAIAIMNAFQSWHSAKKKGLLRHPKDENAWGKENFIQIKRIKEVAELYEELKRRVAQFNMEVQEGSQSSSTTSSHRQKFIIQVVIAGAYYPNYFFQGDIADSLASRDLSGFDPRTTVMLRNLPPYSFLYYKQLQSLFRLYGQVKAISFESSRAYVEFFRTIQDFAVLPEVSLSLLQLRQRPQLELSVFPTEQIELCTGNKPITGLKYSRVNVDFERQTVSPVGVMSGALTPDKIPSKRFFVVNVTEVLEVGHFWGYQADDASLKKQRHLTAEINGRTLHPVAVSLYPNLLCLAPYSKNMKVVYNRAKILHVRGDMVEVFFLDFGNTVAVSCSSLRELPADLLLYPLQAQEFQVTGMCPSAKSIILGNPWSSRARHRFNSLVKGQLLLVSLYSILFGVMRVELFITTGTQNISVVDLLMEEGHAVKAEESFDSQNNHEMLMSLYKDLEDGSYVPNTASNSAKARTAEAKEIIDSLLARFSKSNSLSRTKVRLHGPFSPYKAAFYSLSHKTQCKNVIIDKVSINSLALNENPHYKHQRMLVAGDVSVSPSGSNILLRDTTLMPHIPGLPALIAMLFSPVMELRTDPERTLYTGVLCGLGWGGKTQEAVLPEHDLELTFDVKFDVEDITEINALRMAMNGLVCEGPRGTLRLHADRISTLQSDCQDRLLRLFTKFPPREAVTPVYYPNVEKWNQVDPGVSLKMEPKEPGTRQSRGAPFMLHAVTLLNN